MNLDELLAGAFKQANSYFVSLVRTVVPIAVGYVVATLSGWGLTLPGGSEESAVAGLTVVLSSLWYVVARALEAFGLKKGIAWIKTIGGLMLGVPNTPDYIKPVTSDGYDEEAELE